MFFGRSVVEIDSKLVCSPMSILFTYTGPGVYDLHQLPLEFVDILIHISVEFTLVLYHSDLPGHLRHLSVWSWYRSLVSGE